MSFPRRYERYTVQPYCSMSTSSSWEDVGGSVGFRVACAWLECGIVRLWSSFHVRLRLVHLQSLRPWYAVFTRTRSQLNLTRSRGPTRGHLAASAVPPRPQPPLLGHLRQRHLYNLPHSSFDR